MPNSAKYLSLYQMADGLCQGLSRFSGPSRVAVIYAERPEDPIRVYDPQDLLRGHEPMLREIYIDSPEWRTRAGNTSELKNLVQVFPEANLELSGLISRGGRTHAISYQMWFTDQHPDMCAIGPIERWLEHAVFLLSQDFAFENPLYTATSSYALKEYATHAVRDYVVDQMTFVFGWDNRIFVFPILEAILDIAKTREEGAWPRGKLIFISPEDVSRVRFAARFPPHERPSLKNHRHVRKLLQAVEDPDRKLISFGTDIVGIAMGEMPERRSTAEFQGEFGFLRIAGDPVCSFSDGKVYSSTRQPNLVHLEETLIEFGMDSSVRHAVLDIVRKIVREAGRLRHGCTLVIDLNDQPTAISGQQLEQPMDLREAPLLGLAKALSKVDGALHLREDLHLHAFGCLLHGGAVPGENRARGARFNSALRFSQEHEKVIVVVVSADRPVSVIRSGVELTALCEWKPFSELLAAPPELETWLEQ